MAEHKAAFRAFASGMVQGVGYRYYVYRQAREMGVRGFVRNLMDGRVEVYAAGEKKNLLDFLAHLKKGPAFARVDKVEIKWQEDREEFDTFFIDSTQGY